MTGVNKTASAQFEEERRTRGTKTMKTWTEDLFVQRDAARPAALAESHVPLARRSSSESAVKRASELCGVLFALRSRKKRCSLLIVPSLRQLQRAEATCCPPNVVAPPAANAAAPRKVRRRPGVPSRSPIACVLAAFSQTDPR